MAQVLPSILAADFTRLGDEIRSVETGGARMLHFDVMDGHFVPNLSMGIPVLKSVRRITKLTLDVHLMISNPDAMLQAFLEAGADQLSVHQEVCPHLHRTLRAIQAEGARAGVVLNPSTPVAALEEVLDVMDFVLVMSVNPGFGGQRFIPRSLDKIRKLRDLREQYSLAYQIQVDGGVSQANVADLVQAGCDWLVAGSSVFDSADPGGAFQALQREAELASMARV
ncbi:MAG: ribulose-phosphate 3-epimerase [Bryobacterales bacterium]|jgi:ribulose-phosphate 3-epimerase|nr:ribulose-phosphate 3-epimerase [Bryobacterales bacterium]